LGAEQLPRQAQVNPEHCQDSQTFNKKIEGAKVNPHPFLSL
jgi:hypothetical protein